MKKISFLRMLVISLLGFALTFSSNIQDPPLMTYKVRQLHRTCPIRPLAFWDSSACWWRWSSSRSSGCSPTGPGRNWAAACRSLLAEQC